MEIGTAGKRADLVDLLFGGAVGGAVGCLLRVVGFAALSFLGFAEIHALEKQCGKSLIGRRLLAWGHLLAFCGCFVLFARGYGISDYTWVYASAGGILLIALSAWATRPRGIAAGPRGRRLGDRNERG